jgi:TonB family protein
VSVPRHSDPKPPVAKPAIEKSDTVKSVTPKPDTAKPDTAKPDIVPAPSKQHIITPTFDNPTRSAKPSPASAESSAQAQASAREARKRAEIAAAFSQSLSQLASAVGSDDSKVTVTSLPGAGGGEAFINYGTAVFNLYDHAWKKPEDAALKQAVAVVKIVVARNGDIISADFVNKSGDGSVDRSVQRALDAVKHLPSFPPNAEDTERTFILRFNLETKQSAG